MCVLADVDRRTRRLRAIANACLAIGLSLRLFVTPASPHLRDGLDALVGLMLGFSVAVNLHLLWRARRNRQHPA